MKKNASRFLTVLIAVYGLLAAPVFADLGLSQIVEKQGAPAVGQAVLTAAKAVYADNTDPAVIQQQLTALLNEAVATGNEAAIRYAIVAVMMAGGADNLAQSTAAINDSNAFNQYKNLTADTVAATGSLMVGGGKTTGGGNQTLGGGGTTGGTTGGGETGGGNPTLGGGGETGGGNQTLGGGNSDAFLLEMGLDPNNPFTWGSLTGPGDIEVPATGT